MPWSMPKMWLPPSTGQQVAALAVGVVDHGVEERHPPQLRAIAAHQPLEVDALVDVDPQLDHAGAERAVAHHGRRHDVPAGGLRHLVGRELAAGQRAVREVPERTLAADRLVDALRGRRRRCVMGQKSVALLASSRRPSTSIVPSRSSVRAAWRSAGPGAGGSSSGSAACVMTIRPYVADERAFALRRRCRRRRPRPRTACGGCGSSSSAGAGRRCCRRCR